MCALSTGTSSASGGRYVLAGLLGVAVLFVVRVVVGPFVGNAAHPVTYLAIVAGLAGGIGMIEISRGLGRNTVPWARLWASAVGRGEPGDYQWRGNWLQLLFAGVAGGLYPWVFNRLLGVTGDTWAALPLSLGTGLLWAAILFVVSGVVFLGTGAATLSGRDSQAWAAAAVNYVVYGAVFGVLVGLWQPLLA